MRKYSLPLFLFFILLPLAYGDPVLKVVSGRVKEIWLDKKELVVSFKHPVTSQVQQLVLKIDGHTGFSRGVRLENLTKDDPVAVDYQEEPSGVSRAVSVQRVPINVPVEKFSEK